MGSLESSDTQVDEEAPSTKILTKNDIIRQVQVQTQVINVLNEIKSRLVKTHKKCSIGKTVGSSVSIAGTGAMITGLILTPITVGTSLVCGGIMAGVAGAGTNIATGAVKTVKKKRRAKQLQQVFGALEKELVMISGKIMRHPTWRSYALEESGKIDADATAAVAVEVEKIQKYLAIMNCTLELENASAMLVAVENLPGYVFGVVNDLIVENLAKGGVKWVSKQMGPKVVGTINGVLVVGGLALDIYTIYDAWTKTPGGLQQIEEIVSKLEELNQKLDELKKEF